MLIDLSSHRSTDNGHITHGTCGNCTWDVNGKELILFGIPSTDKRLDQDTGTWPWEKFSPESVTLVSNPQMFDGSIPDEQTLRILNCLQ